jgi:signal peptidase
MTRAARLTTRLVLGALVVAALGVAALFLVPRALGYDTYVITTGSMRGTVDPGGLVISQRVPVAQLEVGDVITYQPPAGSGVDHLVTHRITKIGTDRLGSTTYRTQGDANPAVDPWVFTLNSGVQPVMRWTVPQMGRPVLWLHDPAHRRVALGVPAAALGLIALLDVVRVLRRRDEDGEESLVVIDLTDAALEARTTSDQLASA